MNCFEIKSYFICLFDSKPNMGLSITLFFIRPVRNFDFLLGRKRCANGFTDIQGILISVLHIKRVNVLGDLCPGHLENVIIFKYLRLTKVWSISYFFSQFLLKLSFYHEPHLVWYGNYFLRFMRPILEPVRNSLNVVRYRGTERGHQASYLWTKIDILSSLHLRCYAFICYGLGFVFNYCLAQWSKMSGSLDLGLF